MNAFRTFWNGLDWSVPADMLLSVLPALICITLHELAHGFTAGVLGDKTAKNSGRLTLNPLRHIDVFGLLMMIVFKFGWAKPVPVNMRNFKNPKRGMALCAAAGPVCNVLITVSALFIYGFLFYPLTALGNGFAEAVLMTLGRIAFLSLALAVFNLIPIPPMDGSKILFSMLRSEHYYKLMRFERYGMIILLIVVSTGVLGTPLSAAVSYLYDKLFVIAEFSFELYQKIF